MRRAAARGLRDGLGADGLHGVERWRPRSSRMPTRLTPRRRPRTAAGDRVRIAQVGLHGVDLADAAQRLQVAGEVGPAHRGADAPAAPGERAHRMPADEARAAEHRDQACRSWRRGHARRLCAASSASNSARGECRMQDGDARYRRARWPAQARTRAAIDKAEDRASDSHGP